MCVCVVLHLFDCFFSLTVDVIRICSNLSLLRRDGTTLGHDKIQALRHNANYFRDGLAAMGCETLGDHDSPVVPIMLYQPSKVAAFSRLCLKAKLAVVTVGYPATPLLLARVRFCISAAHTKAQLDLALSELSTVCQRTGVLYNK